VKSLKERFEQGKAEGAERRPRLTFTNDKAMLQERLKVIPGILASILSPTPPALTSPSLPPMLLAR